MKARINTFLNIRTGTPEILIENNPNDLFFKPGDVIEIAETVKGEEYKDNNIWYKLIDGAFVWSGGIDSIQQGVTDYRRRIKNIPEQWMLSGGKDIKVAVLDTGFNLDHPDLKHLKDNCILKDFARNANTNDVDGHGTFILGLLAASTTLKNGINGLIPKANFFLYKVSKDDLGFLDSFAANAILDAISQQVHIINMSFNVPTQEESAFHKAIKTALSNNIIVVSSAGENKDLFEKSVVYPAEFDGVISVGELSVEFAKSISVAFNPKLDLLMPFVDQQSCSIDVLSNFPYKKDKGSSMASAFVTGILTSIMASLGNETNPFTQLKSVISLFNNTIIKDENLQIIKV